MKRKRERRKKREEQVRWKEKDGERGNEKDKGN